jgi:hypothetical protein
MQSIIGRFLGFEKLIGPVLVKIIYYVGAAGILAMIAGAIFMAIFALAGGNLGIALMQLIAAPAVGLVAFVYWRFLCELFMLAFLAYDRLGEIRNLLSGVPASEPDPNHPEF